MESENYIIIMESIRFNSKSALQKYGKQLIHKNILDVKGNKESNDKQKGEAVQQIRKSPMKPDRDEIY